MSRKTEKWLPGHCRKPNSLPTFHRRRTSESPGWTMFWRNVSCWDRWRSSRVFFFFKSPCMFLTAPSSCVTFFSYLPSIKGFLMTRVNPEHEECRGVQCGSEDQKARLYLNLLTLAFVVGRTFQQISGADQRRSRRSFTVLCAQCQHHGMVKVRERNLHTQYSLKIQIYMIFCLKKNHKYTLLS